MTSLARRSLRTTAAAAGIAAIGVSFAGTALAAPALPALPALPGTDALPALPGTDALPTGAIGAIPALPANVSELPQIFTFEAPTVNPTVYTAGPTDALPALPTDALPTDALPALPTDALPAPALPALPTDALAGVANVDGGLGQVNGPVAAPQEMLGSNHVAALPSLDSAKMITDAAANVMAGNSLTQGNTIGA